MSYNFYNKQNMQAVEQKLNVIIIKNNKFVVNSQRMFELQKSLFCHEKALEKFYPMTIF